MGKKKSELPSEKKLLKHITLKNCDMVEEIAIDPQVLASKEFQSNMKINPRSAYRAKKCEASIDGYSTFVDDVRIYCPSIEKDPFSSSNPQQNLTILKKFAYEKGEFYRTHQVHTYKGGKYDEDRCRVGLKLSSPKTIRTYNTQNLYIQRKRPISELKSLGVYDQQKDAD